MFDAAAGCGCGEFVGGDVVWDPPYSALNGNAMRSPQ